jgi:hypothetical protein
MKHRSLAFTGLLLFGCGGGDGGNGGTTGPRPPSNVQGSWSATSTAHTVAEGPLCVRDTLPRPLGASITQNGPSIALNITFTPDITCSFSGTVSDTSISWTLNQQQANPLCLNNGLPCANSDGTVRFLFGNEIRSSSFNGSVSGDQISVSGETVSIVSNNGTPFSSLRVATSIVLQRQR